MVFFTRNQQMPEFPRAGRAVNLQLQIEQIREFIEITNDVYDSYGVANGSNINAIFRNLSNRLSLIMQDKATMTLTVKTINGNPLPNISISGLVDTNGNNIKTNSSGIASGYVSSGNRSLSLGGYTDIQSFSKSYTFVKGQAYTDTWTISFNNYLKIMSTTSVVFSENVKNIDFSIAGGGGGGASGRGASTSVGGGGGGGGYCVHRTGVPVTPNTRYPISIGAGGATSYGRGNNGGATTFMNSTANGGTAGGKTGSNTTPGPGNGNGGTGALMDAHTDRPATAGSSGSGVFYTSFSSYSSVGGGGGGGAVSSSTGGAGGAPYGGRGANAGENRGHDATGISGGGGGGHGLHNDDTIPGGAGGNGACAIRIYTYVS